MGRPPIGKTAMTDAERMRRYRLKHGKAKPVTKPAGPDYDVLVQELAQARARIAELERELTSEREQREAAEANAAKAAPRDNKGDRIAELEAEIRDLRLHIRFGPKRRPAEPKPEKPPLPPDEQREKIIKGLRTRVRNLMSELDATIELNNKIAMRTGDMPRTTRTAIDWVLQPDQRRNADEAAWDKACKGWNAWKNDSDKVRRQAR
jgi:Rad3-related DNA helicase